MKKRLGSMLLTLAMVVSLIPAGVVPVRAEGELVDPVTWKDADGNHTLGYGTDADGHTTVAIDGELKAKFATALTQDSLSTNNQRGLANSTYCFYLAENVELPYGLVIYAGTIWLDLNGHTITYNGTTNGATGSPVGVIKIFSGATLNLVDSKGTGGITRTNGDKIDGILINATSAAPTYFNMYGGAIFGNHRGVNNRDSNSTFNLYGGTIKNNVTTSSQWNGGGVYNGGSFTMHDGTISNNTSSTPVSYYGGGGVFNKEGCQFTMNGGTITDNKSSGDGGGVYIIGESGMFTMTGGSITNNTAGGNGGGVHVTNASTFNLSGNPMISGNTGSGGAASNVYLNGAGGEQKKITVTGTLTNTTPIGVSMKTAGVFTNGLSGKGNIGKFFSDNATYTVVEDNGEAQLTAEYPLWVGGTRVTSVNAGNITGDGIAGTVRYEASTNTLTLNGATITNGYAFATGKYALIGATDMDLTIHVTGNSSLQSEGIFDSTNGGISLVGSSNTLTITVDEGKSLTTIGPTASSSAASESSGIYTNGALVINGAGTINATGGNSGQSSYGIYAKNGITISNGIVTATADTRPTSGSYGISAGNNTLTITGGDITASGSNRAILHNTVVNSTLRGVGYTALDAAEGTSFEAGNGLDLHDYKKVRFFPAVPVTGVTLNKSSTTLTVGGTETLTATVAPVNATNKAVTWSSDNPSVATVDGNGVVTAVAEGTATITVTTADGNKTATCSVTVSAPPTAYSVTVTNDGHGTGLASPASGASNTPVTLTATPNDGYHFKEWQVVSGGVTVDNSSFIIGSADVVIKAAFEADAPTIIPVTGVTLNKASTTLTVDGTETLTATVAPGDATNRAVTWSSGNPSVAAVDTNGVVTAVAPGTATITVTTVDGSKTATCSVTVGEAAPSLTAPTAKTGLTYTGAAQDLVTAGSATGGILQYKLGEGGSYGTSVPAAKDAGSYTVFYRVAGDANHSDVAEQSVPVTISPKKIGLTWADTGFVYDGAAHAPAAAATGLIGADSCTVSVTGAQTNAGTYTATASALSNGNYKLPGAATQGFSITPATLTVTADTLKKAYGAAVPALTYTVEGLKGGDKTSDVLTGALTTTANSTSNAGDYLITQGTLAANANYTLSFTGATLTVLKAAQTAPAKGAGYTITGTTLSVDAASANPNAGNTTHYEIFDGTTVYTSGSVTMAANKTYYVRWGSGTNYNPSPYTEIPAEIGVTVMEAPASMGSVTTTGLTDGRCKIGSTVTVTAIPSSGCEFINWQRPDGSSAGTDAAYSFTATESVILVAAFKEKNKVVATLPTMENKPYTGSEQIGIKAAGTGCTITGTQSATNAGMYTITATLASGYDVWPDGTTAPKALTWRVDKAAQAAPAVEVTDTTISVTISSSQTVNYSTDRETWSNASASMTGMATGSYYFYIVGDDNHYDSPMTVAYVSAPTITAVTIQPSALTAAGVTLNGTAEPKAYANGTYLSAAGFEYKAFGGSWIAVDGTVGGAFNASLSGLAQDTDYVCRAVVTLKDGSTKTYGAEITFHTPKAAPPDDGKIKAVIQSESEADTRKVFVSVERGNDVIATSDTVALNGNSGAEVSFNNLPYGHYNVVVHTVDGDYTATNMLSVEGGSEVATRFTIPIGKLATIVDVKTEETPKTAVEGLNEILTTADKNNAAAGSQDVEIRLEIEKKAEDAADGASAIKGLDDNKIDTYLDMSLFKTTTDLDVQGNATSIETMDIGSTNTEVVEIAIPYANTSRSGLTMYRYHNALAEILTMLTAKPVGAFLDGTYYVDRAGGYIFLYASGFSTYAIGFAESAAYTVTFDANGGTGTMVSQSVNGTAALNANTFTRSGYTFIGWNTAANGSGTSYANTANITPAADLTLYAQWKPNSSGSDTPSGGNGGYSPSTTTAGTRDTVPVSGDSGSVSVSVTVSGVTATIKAPTTAELNKVIGESVKTGDIVMDLRELNRDIATASIPAETIRAIEKAVSDPGNDASSLTIKLTDGSVTFDANALAAVAEQMEGSNLQLHLDGIGTSGLNAAQQVAIKAMDVQAVYDIYLTSNGVRITDFKGGSATVTVTYTLKSGQMGSGVVVWYVADDGEKEDIPTRYNSKEVTFTVEHFSNYIVAYDTERTAINAQIGYAVCPKDATCPISAFNDTSTADWYHDGVHWAIENGVMNGVGDGLFLPNGTTTRAQVATMLYRLAGSPQVSGESVFTDVAESMWYTDAIRWAATHGVVSGFERDGMTVFDPDGSITREQLAAMLYRYAKLDGQGFTGAWMFLLDYPDAADVSEWADEAMHWVIMKGIINGMDGRLNPQSSATRAQTATMFMRYYAESVK